MTKTTASETNEYLTALETAELLRLSRGSLYVQRHRGQAPGSLGRQVGRKLLWRRTDLDAWFDEQSTAR